MGKRVYIHIPSTIQTQAEEIKAAQSEINTIWKVSYLVLSEDKLSFADVMVFAGYLKVRT
eukprot:968844-Amorphochlora_amoeboformis.AAC.1